MTPEGKVKAKIKAILKSRGVWFFCPIPMGLGVHGIPDFIGCAPGGRFVAIEAKAHPNKPTALQARVLDILHKIGAIALWVDETKLTTLELILDAHCPEQTGDRPESRQPGAGS
jgi:hypothetical protein